MFIAYEVALDVIRSLRSIVAVLRRKDPPLATQLERAASSIALKIAEGAKRAGKDRAHFNRIAAGSCAEVRAALAVAEAWGNRSHFSTVKPRSCTDSFIARQT